MADSEILTQAKFYVELKFQGTDNAAIDGYFMECQGFKRTLEVIEHCEVFPQTWGSQSPKSGRVVRAKIPGNAKSENITLRRGMSISSTVWDWFHAVENGKWKADKNDKWKARTYDGDLSIYSQGNTEKAAARFRFFGAWPISYKISDVKADAADFQVEELVLAVDDFIRVEAGGQTTET